MPYIIAEIGQNHNGSLETAKEMVDSLVGTGVNAIKTAKRDIDSFQEEWKTKPYINKNSFGKTYYEHRCALELSKKEFLELSAYSREKGFDFISSFTDIPSFNFLAYQVRPDYYKIASSRVTDLKLLNHISCFDVPFILSTGMSEMGEIIRAEAILRPKIILQCTSSYPTQSKDVNLDVINRYKFVFDDNIKIGISGHYNSVLIDLMAYSMGAEVIERHYTLDKTQKGTDHQCSLDLSDLKELCGLLEFAKVAKGSDDKKVLECELPAIEKLRESK